MFFWMNTTSNAFHLNFVFFILVFFTLFTGVLRFCWFFSSSLLLVSDLNQQLLLFCFFCDFFTFSKKNVFVHLLQFFLFLGIFKFFIALFYLSVSFPCNFFCSLSNLFFSHSLYFHFHACKLISRLSVLPIMIC